MSGDQSSDADRTSGRRQQRGEERKGLKWLGGLAAWVLTLLHYAAWGNHSLSPSALSRQLPVPGTL